MPDRDRVLALHCSFAESEFGNEGLMQIYGAALESDRLSLCIEIWEKGNSYRLIPHNQQKLGPQDSWSIN